MNRALLPIAILVLSVGILLYQAFLYRDYTIDDAFISFRYARHLNEGHGLVWNPGEEPPVEGYSNFLWIVLLSLFMRAGAEPVVVSKVLGLGLGIGCLLVLFCYRNLLSRHAGIAALPPLLTVLYPQWGLWSVGGLETQMCSFLLVFAAMRLLAELQDHKAPWSALLFGLLALTRAEGAVYFLGTLVFLLFAQYTGTADARADRRRHLLWAAAIFLTVYLPYFAWRIITYGYLFPNTYYAKRLFLGGTAYLGDFYLAALPLLAAGMMGLSDRERRISPYFLLLLFAASLPVANIDPQMGDFLRFMVPAIPLAASLAARGVHASHQRIGMRLSLPLIAAVIVYSSWYAVSNAGELSKKSGTYATGLGRAHIPLGKHLAQMIPAGKTIALADCGAIPYYSGLPTIDTWGLLNAAKTHDHDYSAEDVLDQDPEVIIFQSYSGEDIRTPWRLEKQINDAPRFRDGYRLIGRYPFSQRYWLWVFRKGSS